MSSNFKVFRATGDQLALQGRLFKQWGRGKAGDRCILRALLDNAGFDDYDDMGEAVWQEPLVVDLLRQIDYHLEKVSSTYVARRKVLCHGGETERKGFIVKWHDEDASLQEVVGALSSLADSLELQELRGKVSELETTNAELRAANLRHRREHATLRRSVATVTRSRSRHQSASASVGRCSA